MNVVDHIRTDTEEGARRLEHEYKDRLLTVAKRLCPDEAEAEALVWRTLDEAVRHIESLVDPQALFSWMCSIMVRGYSMSNRRKINKQIVYTGELPELPDGLKGVENILQGVDGDILRKAIEDLPPKLRETIILRYFMDLPLLTIARILAVPKGTVSSRLNMARAVLAARLGIALKKQAVALIVAGLFLLVSAAVVIGVSKSEEELASAVEPTGLEERVDVTHVSGQAAREGVQTAGASSAQPLCVATSQPINLSTVRMQSDVESVQEEVEVGQSAQSAPMLRRAVFLSAPERLGDVRSGATLAALDTRIRAMQTEALISLDTVVHDRKAGPNMNLNCTKRSFTIVFR